jgi:MFS transporter, ACS family, allantoate permease
VNQVGLENKVFKREQMVEALKDPKTWLFALFAGFSNIMNSLSNQRQLIIAGWGFTPIQTTLLGCVDGLAEIIFIVVGVTLAAQPKLGRAYAGIIIYIPAIVGAILVNTLPSHNRIGLLFSYWTSSALIPFVRVYIHTKFLPQFVPLYLSSTDLHG